MKISRHHLSFTVSVLAAFAIISPAGAKGEDEELTASPRFREAVEQARRQLVAGEFAGASTSVSALAPSTPFEKYMAASLAMEIAVKRNDMIAQRGAVVRMIESGAAPVQQMPRLHHIAGYLFYRAGALDTAISYLARARALGESDPRASLLLVECHVRQNRLDEASRLIGETIAAQRQAGHAVPESWYDRAMSLAYARKDWAALSSASAAKLSDPSSSAPEWRTAIATYIGGAKPEAEAELDLYRLQAAAGALASERDYQGYAALAAERDYPAEAKAIIEVGQAKGALTATDPIAASLLRSLRSRSVTQLAAIGALPGKSGAASSGMDAARKGDELFSNSRFADAVPYYRVALEKGQVDRDRVTTRLGIALGRSGDMSGARLALAQATGKWGEVAAFWLAWVDGQASALALTPRAATSS